MASPVQSVMLKNGQYAPLDMVNTVFMACSKLVVGETTDRIALLSLIDLCRLDRRVDEFYQKILVARGLMTVRGDVHPDVKNIVLSMFHYDEYFKVISQYPIDADYYIAKK